MDDDVTTVRILGTADAVEAALGDLLERSSRITIVAPWVDSRRGAWPLWKQIRAARGRIERVHVALEDLRSEPAALGELHGWGVLRWIPAADASMRVSLVRGDDGARRTTIVGAGPLAPPGAVAPIAGAVVHEGAPTDGFALEIDGLLHRIARAAKVPSKDALDAYYATSLEAKPLQDRLLAAGAPLGVAPAVEAPELDLDLLTEASEIAAAVAEMGAAMTAGATSSAPHTLAFHGGREDLQVDWFAPLGFWCGRQRLDDRHRHALGIGAPTTGEPLSIAVEINAPSDGIDRKVGGAFARCRSSGHVYLVHRGRIGGGKGVGADLFWSRFRGGVTMAEPGAVERARVVPVARVDGPHLLADIAGFVHEVARIKRVAAPPSSRRVSGARSKRR